MNAISKSDTPEAIDNDYGAAERLQLALDAGAIVGTWLWNIPSDHFSADERFARTFGLSVDDCTRGLTLSQIMDSIHVGDRLRVTVAIEEAMSQGGSYRCEYRVMRSDGIYRWIEANGRVELDAAGAPVRFPGVLLDIEARHAAEAERDRISRLLQIFTAAVPGVVYAKDTNGRMLVGNHGTTLLVGKPPEFYLGKTDLEFLEDKVQARQVMETDQRIMRGGKTEQIEERVDMPDGTATYWLSVKAPLLDDNGEVIGLIGSSIDVTARKNAESAILDLNHTLEERVAAAIAGRESAEAALRQSQKMEAVGQLTGAIAHDFNNLLAGISGSLELMKARLAQNRVADIDRYIAVALGATQRAAALTHRLLAFARRQTLVSVPTDINALIRGMDDLLRRSVGPSINVEVRLALGLWTVLVDPAQVENSLLNLCINACDAMSDGGTIFIETSNTHLQQGPDLDPDMSPGDYLLISVRDSGVGMSDETISRAFEPFFTTKPMGGGTGLGLSMVYGFVRQSGGQIRVQSSEGSGTAISLYLPRHFAVVEKSAEAPLFVPNRPITAGQTILVVDDEPSLRMLVSEVLSSLGYNVLEAGEGDAAMLLLSSDLTIDLLITDIGLPSPMNGRQLAHAARLSRHGIPVLFITGYAHSNALEQAHLEPSTAVLIKPFTMDALVSHVHALVHQS